MADLPATIGRYEVVSRLGQGGMGSLYLAKDPKIGRLLAIKLVRQEFDSPDARQRFAREAQSAGTLRHQNIVTIFDVDEHEGLPFIAMEYIDGRTIADIVRSKAPIDHAKRLQWIEDLCAALAYAHRQGVIHRDIKPANLMVDTDSTLKILDFGLARIDQSTFTATQTLIGTPNYMSPEQIKGGDLDGRSDIFSVGAVLYEVLAYTPAFPGAVHQAMHKILNEQPVPLETLVPGVDPRVAAVVHRALEKDVERRYPDLNIMRHELAAARIPPSHDQPSETVRIGPNASSVRRTHQSSVRYSPESLQRRRNEQIEKKLEEARAKFEAGQIEKARAACEEALFIDPQLPAAVQLMADITGEVEKRQAALYISDARIALQKGQIDLATARANDAMAIRPTAPEVILLLDGIEAATREQARVRQVQDALKKARAHFADGSFESALRVVADVLAIDPGNAAAAELEARVQQSLEEERNQRAEALLAEARALRDSGQRDLAIAKLTSVPHPNPDVVALLNSIRIGPEPPAAVAPPVPKAPTAPPAATPPPAPKVSTAPPAAAPPPAPKVSTAPPAAAPPPAPEVSTAPPAAAPAPAPKVSTAPAPAPAAAAASAPPPVVIDPPRETSPASLLIAAGAQRTEAADPAASSPASLLLAARPANPAAGPVASDPAAQLEAAPAMKSPAEIETVPMPSPEPKAPVRPGVAAAPATPAQRAATAPSARAVQAPAPRPPVSGTRIPTPAFAEATAGRPDAGVPAPDSQLPSYSIGRMLGAAALAIAAVVTVAVVMMRGGDGTSPPARGTTVTRPPAPDPSRPAPPPVRPAGDPFQIQNDDDATEAFMLITKGRLDDAAAIVDRIRKRDPNYNGLKNLQDALALARKSEGGGRKPSG